MSDYQKQFSLQTFDKTFYMTTDEQQWSALQPGRVGRTGSDVIPRRTWQQRIPGRGSCGIVWSTGAGSCCQ